MCGIVGINSTQLDVSNQVIQALKSLEYRGYDSSGLAGIVDQKIKVRKVPGKVKLLQEALIKQPFNSSVIIGHTRWATHGAVTELNAHPHANEEVAVVHNGIVENYLELKNQLIQEGYKFVSETDSEIFPNLISSMLKQKLNLVEIFTKILAICHGNFAILVILRDFPDLMIALRKGSPLVIGQGVKQNFVASDVYALANFTDQIYFLKDQEIAFIKKDSIEIFYQEQQIIPKIIKVDNQINIIEKEGYEHFMLKEIHQQPLVVQGLIEKYFLSNQFDITLNGLDFKEITQIDLVACGSSFYAGLLAKYWLEKVTDIFVEVDLASEYRYRNKFSNNKSLCIFLSQSGETADTVAALKYAKAKGCKILSLVNVKESFIAKESDYVLFCEAGPEISVASTKGFISQITLLCLFTSHVAKKRGNLNHQDLFNELNFLPSKLNQVLILQQNIADLAEKIYLKNNILFLGRNIMFPIALEGALKLKEISYIHAEAIATGELKHGSIALIDREMPVILLAPENDLYEKNLSNAQEIAARQGQIYAISSANGVKSLADISISSLLIEKNNDFIDPFLYVVALQLLAYHVAVKRGTEVDQPRNLAKAVTVE